MQIMKIEEAKERGLTDKPQPRPAPKQKPAGSIRIEHSPEWLEQIRKDIAAGLIPF